MSLLQSAGTTWVSPTTRNPEAAQAIAEKCRKYGVRAEIFGGDISKREVVEQMMHDFFEKFGTIDVLVNNAGGALKMPEGGFEKMPLDYWESQVNLNLNAPAYFSHFADEEHDRARHQGLDRQHQLGSLAGHLGQKKGSPLHRVEGGSQHVHEEPRH